MEISPRVTKINHDDIRRSSPGLPAREQNSLFAMLLRSIILNSFLEDYARPRRGRMFIGSRVV